jgi:hypothetical protein
VEIETAATNRTPPPDPPENDAISLRLDRDQARTGEILVLSITGTDAERVITDCFSHLQRWDGDQWQTFYLLFWADDEEFEPMSRPKGMTPVPAIGCLHPRHTTYIKVPPIGRGEYRIEQEANYERDFETQKKALLERIPPPPLQIVMLYARLKVTE